MKLLFLNIYSCAAICIVKATDYHHGIYIYTYIYGDYLLYTTETPYKPFTRQP
ncbi:BAI_1a_G0051290.mRNA.1.CDS.1 [Saccharomyces cerevisiae]|nr:BAI_1a_G0051290.mRNA.1.CDS.1 [Saccharomyces cerevisiae]CAI7352260.1 BAI_1a_G0051290.mRNA.1.CDS.1 [Saccharomyces cerevisiae]